MRCQLIALFLVSACGAGGDNTIDITHDVCAPIAVTSSGSSAVQTEGIDDALALWRARGVPYLGELGDSAIEIRFEPAALSFHGLYDDERGVVYVNSAISDRAALAIVIAHELGHAFGLEHITARESLMNPGNLDQPPTPEDEAALQELWGRCAQSPGADELVLP